MGKKNRKKITKYPKGIGEFIDDVTDIDRKFFREHPGEKQFLRFYVPGEFYPEFPQDCEYILVTELEPGCRIRQPIVKNEIIKNEKTVIENIRNEGFIKNLIKGG